MDLEDDKIKQLRTLRSFQRQKLENELYQEYAEDLAEYLKEINKLYDELSEETDKLERDRNSLFGIWKEKQYQKVKTKRDQCEVKRQRLRSIFDSTAKLKVELKDFDIETETIILAAMCDVIPLCQNKKILPMIEEELKKE